MFFNAARDGFEIEGAVAAADVAAIDEAETAVAVDQQIVECGVAMDEDDVFRDPRSAGRELPVKFKRRTAQIAVIELVWIDATSRDHRAGARQSRRRGLVERTVGGWRGVKRAQPARQGRNKSAVGCAASCGCEPGNAVIKAMPS